MAQLALRGGAKTFEGSFPHWPIVDDEDRRALVGALDSGVWGIGGASIAEFQKRWAEFTGARYAVLTSAGSTALVAALRACGVGAGDEVIIPAYTFQATATSVLLVNAIPVFADIEPGNFNLDPRAAEAAISIRTACILPVHVAGGPADMTAFTALAEKHHLALVEDACQAHGAAWNGKPVGSIGLAGAFSFQSTKNLPCGEGGAVTTSDERIAIEASAIRNCGGSDFGLTADPVVGTNYRMSEFQASILLSQMRRLPEQMQTREQNAALLDQELSKIPGITPLPRRPEVTRHAYHLYMFNYSPEGFGGASRQQFINALSAEGIPCHGGYSPLYRAGFLSDEVWGTPAGWRYFSDRSYAHLQLPVTEQVCSEAVWFTQRMLLGRRDQTMSIVAAIRKIHQHSQELIA